MVYTLAGQPNGMNSTNNQNATLVTQFDLDDYTSGTETKCRTLENVIWNKQTAALIMGCSYDEPTYIVTKFETITHLQSVSALFLFFYDFDLSTLITMDSIRVGFAPDQMTIERRGSEADDEAVFDLLFTYAATPNNNFSRIQITTDLIFGGLAYQELIDYETLGLTRLQINSFDMVYHNTSNTLITYVADANQGLIILQTSIESQKTSLFFITEWFQGQNAMALGACAEPGILAVANHYGDVFEFDISKSPYPEYVRRIFYRHSPPGGDYYTVGPNIVCSGGPDPDFLALTVAGFTFFTRILDRKALPDSGIFVDIPVSAQSDYADGKVIWLNSNTITAVGSGSPILQSVYIRKQSLTIPQLSEDEFTALQASNGGSPNWYLEIAGESRNGQGPLQSKKFYLNRLEGENPHHHHHSSSSSDDDDDDVPWWGWFLIAIAIVCVIVLGAWLFLRSRRPKEQREVSHTRREAPLLDTEYAEMQSDEL